MLGFFKSLRCRLILLVLLASLPALGLVIYTGFEQRRLAAEYAQDQTLQMVTNVTKDYDNLIKMTQQLLMAIAQSPEVKANNKILSSQFFANLLKKNPAYNNLGAINPEGYLFANAIPFQGPINVTDRLYFQEAIKKRDFVVGEIRIGRITERSCLFCSYPVLSHDGQVSAVVFASLDMTRLREMNQLELLPAESTFQIIDGQGTILVNYPAPEPWIGKNVKETTLVRRILEMKKGEIEVAGVDNVLRLYTFMPFGQEWHYPGYIIIGIPASHVYGPANYILIRNLLALGMVMAMALAMAWLLSSLFVMRRMNVLVDTAHRLAEGDLTARTGLSCPEEELGQLSCAFDNLAEKIQQREMSLLEANQRFQAIFTASPAAIFSLDSSGKVKMWNRMAEKMFGWERSEIEDHALPILAEDENSEFSRLCQRALAGEAFSAIELRCRKKDGSPIDISLAAAPLRNSQGDIYGIMSLALDITERKRLEAQFLQAQKMEAVGMLAGGLAHDFNNLLSAIMGYGELMMIDLSPKDHNYNNIREILKTTERAASLTHQLLALSRRQILLPQVLNINEIVTDMQEMLSRLLGEDIELITVLDPGLGTVKADPGQIEQVIMNLAVNARDAMPMGGKLTIKTANVALDESYAEKHIEVTPGDYVMLAIHDSGMGMDAQTQARIFEPFFTTKETGTGLGLPTVYGIVHHSGGHIRLASEPGQGTTFTIYLPQVDEVSESLEAKPTPTELPSGQETILVVEDGDDLRTLICKALKKCGFNILEARQGNEALTICQQQEGPIHLLLTDVVLPQMSGPELAVRTAHLHPETRVLYMSGYTSDAVIHHGITHLGMNLIRKPFKPTDLMHKVRETLDTMSPRETPRYPVRFEITEINGKPVSNCYLLDVSLKGAKLETTFFMNIDNPVSLVFFAEEEKIIQLDGTIKWVRLSKQAEQTLYHVGIRLAEENVELARLGQNTYFADSYYAVKGQV